MFTSRPDPAMPPMVGELEPIDHDRIFPIYFARRPLTTTNVELKIGTQFEYQAKHYLRGLGPAYGIADADTRPLQELNYVGVLMVPQKLWHEVRDNRLCYQDAYDLVQRRTRGAA